MYTLGPASGSAPSACVEPEPPPNDSPSLLVMPASAPWAHPEQVAKALGELATMRLSSITYVGEMPDGNLYSGSTNMDDRFKVASALIQKAIELLGFLPKSK